MNLKIFKEEILNFKNHIYKEMAYVNVYFVNNVSKKNLCSLQPMSLVYT